MHFVHHAPLFNHFWGYIFPVTESVMAHMKMVYYPMLLMSIYMCISRRDIREFGAPLLGGLAVMPLIAAQFFVYWIFTHHEITILDIIIYLCFMVGAVHLAKRWRTSDTIRRLWPLWIALAALGIITIGILTYHAPNWIVFRQI